MSDATPLLHTHSSEYSGCCGRIKACNIHKLLGLNIFNNIIIAHNGRTLYMFGYNHTYYILQTTRMFR